MLIDLPRVEYKNSNKKDPKKISSNDASIKLNEESARKAKERRDAKNFKQVKLSDIK